MIQAPLMVTISLARFMFIVKQEEQEAQHWSHAT